jgi:hypothetical protein
VILHCNFEELRALTAASEAIVYDGFAPGGAVAAPQDEVEMVELLLPRLSGDVSIETLDDQKRVLRAVDFICEDLLRRLDDKIIETSPGNEEAVALYFDYGHSRAVLNRVEQMGAEMEAIIDLIAGTNPAAASGITFPD